MPCCVCHPSGIALRFTWYPALKRWAKLFRASGAGLERVTQWRSWRYCLAQAALLAGVHCDDALDGAAADGTE
jgi:hypothetical protein